CSTPLTLASPTVIRLSCTLLDRSTPPEARVAAAAGLSELQQPLAFGPLATVASNPSETPTVQAAAIAALAKLKLPAPSAPEEPRKTTMSLSTGPAERWYLSADVPLTKATKLQKNDAG